MRYVVTVLLTVEGHKDQKRSIEKSMQGIMEMLVNDDEPPHQIIGAHVENVQTEKEWKMKALHPGD